MSRGFVKEDDQEETPIIPPRAALPPGIINYVTHQGLKELQDELAQLDLKISSVSEIDERERRRSLAVLNGTRNLLVDRLQSARIPDKIKDPNEVRFGAYVTYTFPESAAPITIQIVGVDEADVSKQKIAFTAPIARAFIGKGVGDEVDFTLGTTIKKFRITKITYPVDN